jgi:hypothetical protein
LAAGVTSAAGGSPLASGAVGVGVAAGAFLANQVWQQKTYSVIMDIELSSRPLSGAKVSQNTSSVAAQANSALKYQSTGTPTGPDLQSATHTASATLNARAVTQSINEEADFKKYQVRAVAYADQVNLKFEAAVPTLETKLVSALANLFEEGPTPSLAQAEAAFAPPPPPVTPTALTAPAKHKDKPKPAAPQGVSPAPAQ